MKSLFFLSFRCALLLAFFSFLPAPVRAQEEAASEGASEETAGGDEEATEGGTEEGDAATTRGTVRIGGKEIAYTARVDTLKLLKKDGKARASIFYIAYTKDGTVDPSKRPIMFCFNGGPGSSSVWLHLGAFGPRRIVLGEGGEAPRPPYQLADNEWSLLDIADLVFIDPVSTGFSRPEGEEKANQFHGFQEDLDSVGEFISRYVSENERWASPKFLAGESYGAVRASGLSYQLQNDYGMYLNGTILVSGLLDFKTLLFKDQNDLPYITFLPSLTTSAFHHKRLPADLQKDFKSTLKAVREFATGEYATALLKGNALSKGDRADIVKQLARFTGLPADKIEAADLRIRPSWFRKELLRSRGEVIGRFDARNKGYDGLKAGDYPDFDPSYAAVQGAFSSGINDYLRRELDYKTPLDYVVLGGVGRWNYSNFTNEFVKVNSYLESALQRNPYLQVLVTCGYTDLATPFAAIEHSVNQLDLAPPLRRNISFEYYQAGHMMYTNLPDLKKLKKDIAGFVRKAADIRQEKKGKSPRKPVKRKGAENGKRKPTPKAAQSQGGDEAGCDQPAAREKAAPAGKDDKAKGLKDLSAVEVAAFLKKNPDTAVLDVRTPAEFTAGHLKGAINVDFMGKDFEAGLKKLDPKKTYIMHCRSGGRSARALATFRKLGFRSILHIKDGYLGWVAAKQPVEKKEASK